MAYASWSVVFGEQPSAAKWNILGTNDASFNDGTGVVDGSQVGYANATLATTSTTTAQIPFDNTIPQSGEGTEVLTCAITPKSTTNILRVTACVLIGSGTGSPNITAAVFRDATANAIAAQTWSLGVSGDAQTIIVQVDEVAGSVASTTFKLRVGNGDAADTIRINGTSGVQLYSTLPKTYISIQEIKAS